MACTVDLRAKAAGKGHLGRGDRQAAFAQVVTGADQSGVDRAVHRGKGLSCDVRIELGNLAARSRRIATEIEVRSSQLIARHADEIQDSCPAP